MDSNSSSNLDSPHETTGGGAGDVELLAELTRQILAIESQIGRRIVGQHQVVRELLVAILAGGHALLVGVPGLAKTMLIRTLARAVDVGFRRIQFTPDLMPADVTGTDVLAEDRATGERAFRFVPGPIFANIVLADEINRTPPKTQAALLEAMQERQVTVGGRRHELPLPFFVLATQNPLDQEGTYPLPEAQMDRFLLQIQVDYPSQQDELRIAMESEFADESDIEQVIDGQRLTVFQQLVQRLPMSEVVADYAVRLTRATRPDGTEVSDSVKRYVRWGAGPRASRHLVLAAKAWAAMEGRSQATATDVQAVAKSVLRHRVRTNFAAEADGITTESFLDELIGSTSPIQGEGANGLGSVLRSSATR